jgi:HlyD family secretion protein
MKRRTLIVLALAMVAAGGIAFYLHQTGRETARDRIMLLGNVELRTVDLAFKVGGRIAALKVDEGDPVAAGDILASLDPRYFDDDLRIARARRAAQAAMVAKLENGTRPEEIAQARANGELARATFELNRTNLTRQNELLRTAVSSQQTFDTASAALRQAQAQLDYAQQSLRLAELGPRKEDIDAARAQLALEDGNVAVGERALADAALIAPSDGFILTRAREPGAIAAAGETIFTLAVSSPVWVRAYVDEPELGRVGPGMAASVTTDSAPGKIYHGHVGFISPVAEFTPKTVETRELRTDLVYRLRVIVDNPDQGLRQGMPVTVTLDDRPGN